MTAPHNVELEAAKFLQKLIQESTDEPRKLATKLYVILQHMRSSGKENSMPYQVISRAMETVINQHGLDIEALMSSRLPMSGGTHMGDSSSTQFAGSSQTAVIAKDSKSAIAENELTNSHSSSRPPVGPSSGGHDIYQGSVSHLSTKSLDHESPSSYDTRSANSQSQERHDAAWEKANQSDTKKAGGKRKRTDSSSTTGPRIDNSQQLDTGNLTARKGKAENKVEAPVSLSVKGSEYGQFNMVQSSGQMERISSLPDSSRSTNITNSMQRAANSKYPEEFEVSSAHSALVLHQGGPRLPTHDILTSRALWNQNRVGSSVEAVSRFPFTAGSSNSAAEMLMHQSTAPPGPGASGKVHGAAPGASGSYPAGEPGIPSQMHFGSASFENNVLAANMTNERSSEVFSASPSVELSAGKAAVDSEYWKHGFMKGSVTNTSERSGEAQFFSDNRADLVSSTLSTGKALEHEGGDLNVLTNANKIVQSGIPGNIVEMNMLRGAAPRDTGKSPISHAAGVSNMPFKEQHLKQLRAQCLVFLSFRNGMMPKKLHLEIALGNFHPKEDGPSKELIDNKGKELSINDPSTIPEVTMPFGSLNNASETEIAPQAPSSTGIHAEANLLKESEDPNMIQEIAESQAFLTKGSQPSSSSVRCSNVSNHKGDLENAQEAGIANQASSLMGISKQMKADMISWAGIGSQNEAAKGSLPRSTVPHESVPERKDPSQSQLLPDCNSQESRHADRNLTSFPSREQWKPISGWETEHQTVTPVTDANLLKTNMSEGSKYLFEDDKSVSEIQRRCIPDGLKTVLADAIQKTGSPTVVETDQEEQNICLGTDLRPAPKYTTSEKWIMEKQRRRLSIEKSWLLKQQKTERRIATCSDKLKETVSSSEDISAKTKSVIELKKLQLLELQRRLRSDILNDFFKPIAAEMDRLKSAKKHRIGRRSKQIERFEQKMKEERQKRIRERQKEFFSEIEVHKERLEDIFKMKRERWKGFNKYTREFHKRKERIHREKNDRIQREKINLLKINDVEGYLRMVQDAKSDRVKQLLKETEKYLQKLGSRLREAKTITGHFENDIENQATSGFESNEVDVENEDEADQAKHYLESNEKYYLMAHSIKESIMEQPTCLVGGKLREYQMNGLRWLVSLYNNHLNGILADEMGLGKTVQVIALMCYLMETKNDRGPFLVVVPSSVLPGWESEINFWAPIINKIVYSGPPEERRRLFKERIVQQKFNVLLTTYEYLMNKHDRPKLSKLHWHYIIIDEGHRIKNASCKLNADLKHYHSSHRLLLTGTPLQNNLEELWALLNFLLPNIFNSSEDFSQWFNKPFESSGDNSADEALLSEEENLLIINRLHQVLRPFVLRRLKHKVENQLPEKIERLVRCEASAYQKLLMRRVEDNLGAIGSSKSRSVHNSVIELRNICNHPYLSQLHAEEVHDFIPKHYLPNIVRLCGKLEMLDRLLPKLKATDHRVLFFSTMTRLLDVMEDYLCWKQYRYLRLDGHTSGCDRGALIDQFNQPGSPFFIFLLSIRAGGVGVNLQAADTVIIFDTDWNPQVDLQAQARAHRIGQKKDVLVLRLETVQTVEEQVRAAAEHKLGVANQSITAGFFDNNTSAEDRREYLESLLRECKKEEAAPVLDDDALNDLIARSESEIDIFEAVDRQRREEEVTMWRSVLLGLGKVGSESIPPLPSRLITDDDLKSFCEAMKVYDVSNVRVASNVGGKRKGQSLGGLDTQHYGRGKRAREVRSYEEQWTEEEFEKLCQADESPDSPKLKEEGIEKTTPIFSSGSIEFTPKIEPPGPPPPATVSQQPPKESVIQQTKEVTITPPSKRGRGRPKRVKAEISPCPVVPPTPTGAIKTEMLSQNVTVSNFPLPLVPPQPSGAPKTEMLSQNVIVSSFPAPPGYDSLPSSGTVKSVTGAVQQFGVRLALSSDSPPLPSVIPVAQSTSTPPSVPMQAKEQTRKTRGRGKNQAQLPLVVPVSQSPSGTGKAEIILQREAVFSLPVASCADSVSSCSTIKDLSTVQSSVPPTAEEAPRRRGRNQASLPPVVPVLQAPPAVVLVPQAPSGTGKAEMILQRVTVSSLPTSSCPDSVSSSSTLKSLSNEQSVVPPAIPVLPPTSEAVKMDLRSVRPVPSNPIVPGPDSIPSTSVVTTLSGTVHQFGVAIAPSSQPKPPFTYEALGSQSVHPSPPVPKQSGGRGRGRGRGRKPQSGVDAPQRRGRRRGPVAPIGAAGLAVEGQKLTEQQQIIAQVSPGRKSIGTRRKRENETIEPTNVDQVQASEVQKSGVFAAPEAKPSEQSDYLSQNEQQKGLSTKSESSGISSDKTDSKKTDGKAQEMKGLVVKEAVVSDSMRLVEKKVSSTSVAAAAVIEQEILNTKKDASEETGERNDSILQENVASKPGVCELEIKLDAGSCASAESTDLVEEKSIVKTNMEGTSAVPSNAEPLVDVACEKHIIRINSVSEMVTSVLDLKMDKWEDQSGKEEGKDQQIKAPGLGEEVVSEPGESKILEGKTSPTLSTLETAAPVVDPETETAEKEVAEEAREVTDPILQDDVSKPEACEAEAKINAGSFENVANPRDVIEENLIVGTSLEGTSAVPVIADPMDDVTCQRPAHDASVSETKASVFSLPVENYGEQSGKEDAEEQEMKCPVQNNAVVSEPEDSKSLEEKKLTTLSKTLEPEALVGDCKIEKTEKEVDAEALESNDPIMQEAVVAKPETCLETEFSASPDNLVGERDLGNENSMAETKVGGTSDITLSADPFDNVPFEKPSASGAETVRLKPEACEAETEFSAGPENLADERDLGKENSIMEVKVGGTSDIAFNADPLDDVPCDKPSAPDASVLAVAASVTDIAMDVEYQSGKEEAKEQFMDDSAIDDIVVTEPGETKSLEGEEFLALSTLETEAQVVDPEIQKIERKDDVEAREISDPILQASEPETKINAGFSESVADPGDLVKDNSTVETNLEGTSAVPQNVVDPSDEMPLAHTVEEDAEEQNLKGALLDEVVVTGPSVAKTQSSEDKKLLTLSMSEKEAQIVDPQNVVDPSDSMPMDDTMAEGAEEQKLKCALLNEAVVTGPSVAETGSLEDKKLLTLSTLEKEAQIVDPETETIEKQVDAGAQERDNPILSEAVSSEPESCEPEIIEAGSLEIVGGPRDVKETNTNPSENVPCEQTPSDALVLETEASVLEVRMDECVDQSEKTDTNKQERVVTLMDNGLVSVPAATENLSLEERETESSHVGPSHEKPDTHLHAGSSEDARDSENIVTERNDTIRDEGLLSGSATTENQSLVEREENFIMGTDKGVTPDPAVSENQSLEVRETQSSPVGPPHEKPETQVNAGSAEDAGDSEHIVTERNSTIHDEGLLSESAAMETQSLLEREENLVMEMDKEVTPEPAVSENQSLEVRETEPSPVGPPHEKPETQVNAGSAEDAEDSEHIVTERNDTIRDEGLLSKSAATENRSLVEREENLVMETDKVTTEPAVNENQSLEERKIGSSLVCPPLGKPETQVNAGSSEVAGDSEHIVTVKNTVRDKGLISESAATENQSLVESEENLAMEIDKEVTPEPAVTENQRSEERETVSSLVHEKPETQLISGASEDAADSEDMVIEWNETIPDKGLLSEPGMTEDQSCVEGEENLVMETDKEVTPEVPLNPIANDDVVPFETLLDGSSTGVSSIQMDSGLVSEGAQDSSSAVGDLHQQNN